MQDTLGGHTDALLADIASTAPMIKQGRLRMVVVTTAKRIPEYDAVPAIAEFIPGFEMTGWMAIVAPTGTRAEAIRRFNRDLATVLADKDVADRIRVLGPIPEPGPPEKLAAFMNAERATWEQL